MSRPVAFILTHDEPGGARTLWQQLAASFLERGVPVEYVALYPKDKPGAGHPWITLLSSPLRIWTFPVAILTLARHLRHLRASATISALPAANIISSLAGWIAGVDLRITSHHSPVQTHSPLLAKIDRLVATSPVTSRIVCVSQAVRSSLEDYPSAYLNKIAVIRNALAPLVALKIQKLARHRSVVPPERPAIAVAAGRLAEQKNYPTLLRALSKTRSVQLRIIGEGSDRPMLEAMVRDLGITDRVSFFGLRTHDQTLEIMAECDIFVQPSLYEGHSIALLEAAALGLPLIVSDIPTQTEALIRRDGTVCGIAVGVMDDEALARALDQVAKDPTYLAVMSEQSLSIAAEFDFSHVVDGYHALIAAAGSDTSRKEAP